jgi:hypothetical protein
MKKETNKTLNIIGYDKKPINNKLASRGNTDKVAILFPGIGYTCQMPVLYYATAVLLDKGYDVLWVEYKYDKSVFSKQSTEESLNWLNFDAEASYNAAMAEGKYKSVVLVGKSLGSFALAHLSKKGVDAKAVWLTPLLGRSGTVDIDFYNNVKESCKEGLFVIGTSDPLYSEEKVNELRQTATVVTIDGADHSLEIDGSPQKSLEALGKMAEAISKFV